MSAATDQLSAVLNDCIKEREELRELKGELLRVLRLLEEFSLDPWARSVAGEAIAKAEKEGASYPAPSPSLD